MGNIVVYTDGSCLGNPGAGGWAAIINRNGEEHILKGGEPNSTNNRMEMKAVIEALRWISKNAHGENASIYSDSSLVINSIKKGWKRKTNLDLWEEFDEVMAKLKNVKLDWNWVKGHADNKMNQRVDELAVKESKKIPKSVSENASAKVLAEVKKLGDGYYCKNCHKKANGLLGWMPDSEMIRVDCEHCGKYIMFGEKNKKNIDLAKKHVLVSKKQLEKIIKIKENRGDAVGENDLKDIKKWTREEAEVFISSEQTLF
ncbi:hypothetical protein C0416_04870 [bacterium]|nr:hypothetical protein [bacterium]